MLAFVNTTVKKSDIIAQLEAHAAADEIVKGQYWRDGKGCAVGCTIHSGNHAEYEPRFGIPQMIAHLEDCIFEGLPDSAAKDWPLRFMRGVKHGSDLSLIGWKFLHWLLTNKDINPGIEHPSVCKYIRRCADVLLPLTKGQALDKNAAMSARSAAMSAVSARSAAMSAVSAESAAVSAAWSARSAASAASAASAVWSAVSAESAAVSAAWSARSAVWSAVSAVEAASAESAESAAVNAAWSARSAVEAVSAESAAWLRMADYLIELIDDALMPGEAAALSVQERITGGGDAV